MILYELAPFWGRNDFGPFLAARNLCSRAVEVGTHRGWYAVEFLRQWPGQKLYCVDDYRSGYDPNDPASQGNRTDDEMAARMLLSGEPRAVLLRKSSMEASHQFYQQVDFVYLDGCHKEYEVINDINSWWACLKSGGVLAGHDILYSTLQYGPDIQRALHQCFGEITVYLVPECDGSPWSWYVFKP